jgi:hypothetical protein
MVNSELLYILKGCKVRRLIAVSRVCHYSCICAILLAAGCGASQRTSPGDPANVTVDDILRKSGAAYQGMNSLQARGVLRDCREGAMKIVPVSWDFVRPDKCRLQLGMDVAIISGENWWTYDAAAGQFRKHSQFTRTPIETASFLLSKGVPFFVPSLWTKGSAAFAAGRSSRNERWQLQGVGWHADAPCYVMIRKSQEREELLRVWVDQDRFLLRGWMLSVPLRDGRERPILECSYPELTVDGQLPSDWLQLKPPTPLKTPSAAGTGEQR